MKNTLLRLATDPTDFYLQPREQAGRFDYVDFRRLLGDDAWNRLVPAIQERFDVKRGHAVRYAGIMYKVNCNFVGWLFAQLTRLLGTPLTPYSGKDISTIVRVYDDEKYKGTVWEREYRFPGKDTLIVRSIKCLDKDRALLESIDGGIRMRLRVYEDNGKLVFASVSYFLDLLGVRIPISDLFTPGKTEVVHTELGEGDFQFTFRMTHPWFGETFFQEGVFHIEET